jgi:hypothetical protein
MTWKKRELVVRKLERSEGRIDTGFRRVCPDGIPRDRSWLAGGDFFTFF